MKSHMENVQNCYLWAQHWLKNCWQPLGLINAASKAHDNIIFIQQLMNYSFSLSNQFEQLTRSIYPLFYFAQQQIQPTTILVSSPESCLASENKNEPLPKMLASQSTIDERSGSPDPRTRVRKEGKAIKKEGGKKKDQNFGFRNQNKDRNMLSSILKGYIQFILHNRGMVKLIETLSKKRHLENGVSCFYDFMSKTFPTKKTYVGIQYMKQAIGKRPNEDDMRYILAVTLKHYFQDVYVIGLFQGGKLKKKMRLSLLKKVRSIFSMLFQQ